MRKFSIFNFQFSNDPERGQSLFELIVAIAISALVISALVSITTNSIQNAIFSKNKAQAGTYGQQTAEWLRGQRDSSPVEFWTRALTAGNSSYCMPDLGWTHLGDCTLDMQIPQTIFSRQVNFSWPDVATGKNIVQADVVISWEDSKGLHTVTNSIKLSDWRQK